MHIHIHTHIYIYRYTYICICIYVYLLYVPGSVVHNLVRCSPGSPPNYVLLCTILNPLFLHTSPPFPIYVLALFSTHRLTLQPFCPHTRTFPLLLTPNPSPYTVSYSGLSLTAVNFPHTYCSRRCVGDKYMYILNNVSWIFAFQWVLLEKSISLQECTYIDQCTYLGFGLLEAPHEQVLHGPLLGIYLLRLCPHFGAPTLEATLLRRRFFIVLITADHISPNVFSLQLSLASMYWTNYHNIQKCTHTYYTLHSHNLVLHYIILHYTQGCGAETIFFRSGSLSGSDFQKVSAPELAPAPIWALKVPVFTAFKWKSRFFMTFWKEYRLLILLNINYV